MPYTTDDCGNSIFKATDNGKTALLIGDSIRCGSCETTKKLLEDVCEVVYPADNCRSSSFIMFSIIEWAMAFDGQNIDFVHFNCGQWDTAHFNHDEVPLTSLGEYERNIHAIIRSIRRLFPKAKIAMATTTPINPDPQRAKTEPNPRTREDIVEYNKAAVRAATEEGILINDVHAKTEAWGPEMYCDHCHFTPEGFEKFGGFVADFIRENL